MSVLEAYTQHSLCVLATKGLEMEPEGFISVQKSKRL